MNKITLNIKNIERKAFYLGIFFLATAPAISVLLFIISILKSPNNNVTSFLKDWWNKILLIVSLLMVVSCFLQSFLRNPFPIELDSTLTWIGLVNWIPLFWCFWAFQPYLRNPCERKRIILFLISGTIPVLFSGFAQYWLNINGPWELFNGIIIWYQRPIEITDGLTGPFNNTNYAGAWLATTWPFVLAIFKKEPNKKRSYIYLLLIILFVISIVLTNSRNAWIGLLFSIPIMMGKKIAIWTFLLLIIIFFTILLSYSNFTSPGIKEFILGNLPHNFMSNFPNQIDQISEAFPRLEIWRSSIEFLSQRPLTGWGAGSFPLLYELQNNNWMGHPHNLLLEIALSYGILPSIILSFFVIILLTKSLRIRLTSFNFNNIDYKFHDFFDRAWICAIIFLIIAHLLDIQYFDLRISIISWILLAGLRSMILEQSEQLK